ncbi:MAG: flagellar hook assembly protein FlgD [Fimbriimonadaceae bacterium]
MAIEPLIGTAGTAAGAASPANGQSGTETLDYNDFLKLLLAQMQNQDPLKPMDSTEYVSQLATFSNVEQALKQNAKLDQLLITSNIAQANGVVGKTITSPDGSITGQVISVKIDAQGATAQLTDGRTLELTSGVTIGA